MKKYIITYIAFILAMPLCAQPDKASLINDIKKESNLYLYGDVTLSSLEVAYEVALNELQASLAEWASDHSRQAVERTQITDLSLLADTLVMKRYGMFRVFAYVHKAKVMEVLNKNGFKIKDKLVTEADPYNKSKLTQRKVIAQVPTPAPKDVPAVGPTPAEPTTKIAESSSKTSKPTEKVPSTKPETAKPIQTDSMASFLTEGLKEIFPKSKGTSAQKQEKGIKKNALASAGDQLKEKHKGSSKLPAPAPKKETTQSNPYQKELEKILSAKDFFDLEGIMMPMKKKGIITAMGRYSRGTDVSDCYLVVFDTDGNIRALLSPGKEHRLNIATNTMDSTSNYTNCGAIWFKMKDNAQHKTTNKPSTK